MKLDVNVLRYLSHEEWRTLTAVELGQKNHELVPTTLISTIAKLKHGGSFKALSTCLKHKLLHHENGKYDGYRLTNLGYDFLAIHTLTKRGTISSVGRQIGVGKESDIFEVADEGGRVMALKLHRLGRTSFRAVKSKRDYLRKGNHYSWLYLSRLAAIKEYAFMKALGERGLPVPEAIDQNRHAVLMELVEGVTLVQIRELENPGVVYERMMDVMCDIVHLGLIHCDYNEFNVMLSPDGRVTVIDFPQMVSISHANAKDLFHRDVDCVMRFFRKKLNYWMEDSDRPEWEEVLAGVRGDGLDSELHASGFKNCNPEDAARLSAALAAHAGEKAESESGSESDSGSEGLRSVGSTFEGGEEADRPLSEKRLDVTRAESTCAGAGEHLSGKAGEGGVEESGGGDSSSFGEAGVSVAQLRLSEPPRLEGEGPYGCLSAATSGVAVGNAPAIARQARARDSTEVLDADVETLNGAGDAPTAKQPLSAAESAHAQRRVQARVQQHRRSQAARQAARKASRNATKGNKNAKENTSLWD